MSIARALPIASRVRFTRAPRVGTRAAASAFPGAARTRATPSINGLPRGLIHRQPCGRKSNDTHRCDAFPPPGLEWIPTPEAVFNVENAAIFPFWLGMIAFPKNKVTETVMGSYAVPVLLGLVYIYLTYYSFSDPRIIEAFSTGKPDLAALSKGFSYEWCMAVGWAHFIAMDLCRKDFGLRSNSRYQRTRDFSRKGIDRSKHGSQGTLPSSLARVANLNKLYFCTPRGPSRRYA